MKKLRKYEEVVKRGISVLDSCNSIHLRWRERIDKNKISLLSSFHCPLGQLCGTYLKGLAIIHPLKATNKYYLWEKWAEKNGFSVGIRHPLNLYKENKFLVQEWKRQLG